MDALPPGARSLLTSFGELVDRKVRELAGAVAPDGDADLSAGAWRVAGAHGPAGSATLHRPKSPWPCSTRFTGRDATIEQLDYQEPVECDPCDTARSSRSRVLEFAAGDAVHVWSNSKNKWMEDGVVEQVLTGGIEGDGTRPADLPRGSVLVAFNGGASVKWVSPAHFRSVLKRAYVRQVPVVAASPAPAVHRRAPSLDAETAKCSVCSDPDDTLVELDAIEQQCAQRRCQYVDPEFEPVCLERVSFWCRPQDVGRHNGQILKPWEPPWQFLLGTPAAPPEADWQLFRGVPSADDVQQGELGDCWFLSSLAALAEFQGGLWLRKLLPGQDAVSPAGVYLVRLCLGGRWRNIIVDDRLPAIGGGTYYVQLAYCVTNRLQLWASLIEKAFAKACGSYQAIVGGEAGEALSALTGWPCTLIRFDREDFDADILWATLCSSRDAEFLMTCSTTYVQQADEGSLVPFHVYSLMSVVEVRARNGQLARLVKIRNPHTKLKWQGAWSDASGEWTREAREQVGYPKGGIPPGVFFMELQDFLKRYAHCTICRIRSQEWHEARTELSLPREDAPCVGVALEAAETTECCISMVQPEERLRQGPLYGGLPQQLGCLGFILLQGGGPEAAPTAAVTAHLRARATVSADCWLQPGCPYLLVPLSWLAGAPIPASLACVSSRAVTFRERRLTRAEVRMAWAAWARHNDPTGGERFREATLYIGKADGGALVILVENRTDGNLGVEFVLRSDQLRLTRGSPTTKDWLQPGYAQILQVALPQKGAGRGISWKSQHKLSMTTRTPESGWHSPALAAPADDSLHLPFRLAG